MVKESTIDLLDGENGNKIQKKKKGKRKILARIWDE